MIRYQITQELDSFVVHSRIKYRKQIHREFVCRCQSKEDAKQVIAGIESMLNPNIYAIKQLTRSLVHVIINRG